MNIVDEVESVFSGTRLTSAPDYSIRCVTSDARQPVFGVMQFVSPLPRAKFNLSARICPQCGAGTTNMRRVERRIGIRRFHFTVPHPRLGSVPTCEEHSRGRLRLVAELETWTTECALLYVFAESSAFLREVMDFVRQSNIVRPPWITFPRMSPFSGGNGVIEGAWVREVWVPYWRGLAIQERAAVLTSNPPPQSWIGWEKCERWQFMLKNTE